MALSMVGSKMRLESSSGVRRASAEEEVERAGEDDMSVFSKSFEGVKWR